MKDDLNAFLEIFEDAKSYGEGPLSGKTIAIKDNMLFEGHKATAGSKILEGFVAPYDATVVKKLKEAGAIIVGRTNMDEFAMGSSTESSAYGVTKNPHDPERTPGGSSGGSAAAVAAGLVWGSLGSDTGGSIRQPAALCGIVGLKPTYGRVSRHGLIALGSSLDQIGPFAKTVSDAELIYNVIKGQDPMDSTTISEDTYSARKKFGKTIGVPRDFVEKEGISEEVKKNFEEAIAKFESLGYGIMDISLPSLAYALSAYYIILPAEASSNLARFDGVKYGIHKDGENSIDDYFKTRGEGFGEEVRRRIILGTYVLSSGYYDEYYGEAQKAKEAITAELRQAFRSVDLVLTPTTPSPAFKFGEKSSPLEMYLEDIFTVPANIAGCPAISLPSGFSGKLPLGIELTADLGREDNLFKAGKDFLNEN
ncbi:MAG: glutaminyl-tRNA synthase (glutamine-hydrolyzing) subunit A [Candidatus Zambryskibacteria bacterium RIFCSPLOWO2_02_FULL_51_21]|uniref:Glutamyl-tRNA(Gln) amidotransferase subunit A n=1 Tax=Candidatus Zambryskibacteria bacterium RIFCSPHIGHO2_02_FULL_43_37 TaxID=1802749 RepID=A0A1G2TH18_9BACT|nr:MAG: glutaminyl-tRNA synthase (glutamine-hydrolyzing) subunit A [Candidatus Zambryskibacteria bacterium RIFCSPHIGHO2_01_FULL_52_18]OHA96482.1 MAG: glutaminyl-tRNA synthase (glutamine-hydrolyzing) subunit A [Candidatus Zambryskibacteria bacterium RIFCSPHIGHO2_02_FULL_43_37]OHB11255.1 MAG: glutaminyl-tRNA synthase (glutamine-hydrolyzing) subunit A [Candidatus Zambryskibacteria bacterium RIFCSPLOWO2_02_FULL_51_21]